MTGSPISSAARILADQAGEDFAIGNGLPCAGIGADLGEHDLQSAG